MLGIYISVLLLLSIYQTSNAAFVPWLNGGSAIKKQHIKPCSACPINNHEVYQNDYIDGYQNYSRRGFMASSIEGMVIGILSTKPCFALDENESSGSGGNDDNNVLLQSKERILLKGKVNLQSGVLLPDDISTSALYVTARPNSSVDVPRAILDGSNGKPPPVLAARLPNVQFPLSFELKESDLTVEGNSSLPDQNGAYWWEGKDLTVSARWDTDGVAATRDPTDLVGRSTYLIQNEDVSIQLQGRGFTGKLVTGKSKK